jgi:hypothetical protein
LTQRQFAIEALEHGSIPHTHFDLIAARFIILNN